MNQSKVMEFYHSYVKGEMSLSDISKSTNIPEEMLNDILNNVSNELAKIVSLQAVYLKENLLKKFLTNTYDGSEVLKTNYISNLKTFDVSYKLQDGSLKKERYYIATYEEVLDSQFHFEKIEAFEPSRWYSVDFLAHVLKEDVSKIRDVFTSCRVILPNREEEIYGSKVELLATWLIGKEEFYRRVAELTIQENREIQGGSFTRMDITEGYYIYRENQ